MDFSAWEAHVAWLRGEYHRLAPADRTYFFRQYDVAREFVKKLPKADKVPLLLYAYEHYRDVEDSDGFVADRFFWTAAYGALITRLLSARLEPTGAEACLILGLACRRIAEGCALRQPIEIVERTFRNCAYPADLFDSARAYRNTLEISESKEARKARRELDALLWHDVKHPLRGCWTARIQRAIAGMPARDAFAWQWLLRNGPPANAYTAAGRKWVEEGRRRLTAMGEDEFVGRLDEWFRFRDGERIRLSAVGNQHLRSIVLHGGLADQRRTLPILRRLSAAAWSQRGKMRKMVDGLGVVLV